MCTAEACAPAPIAVYCAAATLQSATERIEGNAQRPLGPVVAFSPCVKAVEKISIRSFVQRSQTHVRGPNHTLVTRIVEKVIREIVKTLEWVEDPRSLSPEQLQTLVAVVESAVQSRIAEELATIGRSSNLVLPEDDLWDIASSKLLADRGFVDALVVSLLVESPDLYVPAASHPVTPPIPSSLEERAPPAFTIESDPQAILAAYTALSRPQRELLFSLMTPASAPPTSLPAFLIPQSHGSRWSSSPPQDLPFLFITEQTVMLSLPPGMMVSPIQLTQAASDLALEAVLELDATEVSTLTNTLLSAPADRPTLELNGQLHLVSDLLKAQAVVAFQQLQDVGPRFHFHPQALDLAQRWLATEHLEEVLAQDPTTSQPARIFDHLDRAWGAVSSGAPGATDLARLASTTFDGIPNLLESDRNVGALAAYLQQLYVPALRYFEDMYPGASVSLVAIDGARRVYQDGMIPRELAGHLDTIAIRIDLGEEDVRYIGLNDNLIYGRDGEMSLGASPEALALVQDILDARNPAEALAEGFEFEVRVDGALGQRKFELYEANAPDSMFVDLNPQDIAEHLIIPSYGWDDLANHAELVEVFDPRSDEPFGLRMPPRLGIDTAFQLASTRGDLGTAYNSGDFSADFNRAQLQIGAALGLPPSLDSEALPADVLGLLAADPFDPSAMLETLNDPKLWADLNLYPTSTVQGELVHAISLHIEAEVDGPFTITNLPVVVERSGKMPQEFPVFRVEHEGGTFFIDHMGTFYETWGAPDESGFLNSDAYPPGALLHFPVDGHIRTGPDGRPLIDSIPSPASVDNPSEKFVQFMDRASTVVGVGMGLLSLLGGPMTAWMSTALFASIAWQTGRSGQRIHNMAQQHVDMMSAEAMWEYTNFAMNGLGLLTMGATGLARLGRVGNRASIAASNMAVANDVLSVPQLVFDGYMGATQFEEMSSQQQMAWLFGLFLQLGTVARSGTDLYQHESAAGRNHGFMSLARAYISPELRLQMMHEVPQISTAEEYARSLAALPAADQRSFVGRAFDLLTFATMHIHAAEGTTASAQQNVSDALSLSPMMLSVALELSVFRLAKQYGLSAGTLRALPPDHLLALGVADFWNARTGRLSTDLSTEAQLSVFEAWPGPLGEAALAFDAQIDPLWLDARRIVATERAQLSQAKPADAQLPTDYGAYSIVRSAHEVGLSDILGSSGQVTDHVSFFILQNLWGRGALAAQKADYIMRRANGEPATQTSEALLAGTSAVYLPQGTEPFLVNVEHNGAVVQLQLDLSGLSLADFYAGVPSATERVYQAIQTQVNAALSNPAQAVGIITPQVVDAAYQGTPSDFALGPADLQISLRNSHQYGPSDPGSLTNLTGDSALSTQEVVTLYYGALGVEDVAWRYPHSNDAAPMNNLLESTLYTEERLGWLQGVVDDAPSPPLSIDALPLAVAAESIDFGAAVAATPETFWSAELNDVLGEARAGWSHAIRHELNPGLNRAYLAAESPGAFLHVSEDNLLHVALTVLSGAADGTPRVAEWLVLTGASPSAPGAGGTISPAGLPLSPSLIADYQQRLQTGDAEPNLDAGRELIGALMLFNHDRQLGLEGGTLAARMGFAAGAHDQTVSNLASFADPDRATLANTGDFVLGSRIGAQEDVVFYTALGERYEYAWGLASPGGNADKQVTLRTSDAEVNVDTIGSDLAAVYEMIMADMLAALAADGYLEP